MSYFRSQSPAWADRAEELKLTMSGFLKTIGIFTFSDLDLDDHLRSDASETWLSYCHWGQIYFSKGRYHLLVQERGRAMENMVDSR